MTEQQFCYWLMGLFELGKPRTINYKQAFIIQEHLKLVPLPYLKNQFCAILKQDFFTIDLEKSLVIMNMQKVFFDEIKTKKILNQLSQEFVNYIDNNYPIDKIPGLYFIHQRTFLHY